MVSKNTVYSLSTNSLIKQYAESRDISLRNMITERYYPFIKRVGKGLASKYLPSRHLLEEEDAINLAAIGFMEALERFGPEKNVKLTTYAMHRMRGALLDSIRQLSNKTRDGYKITFSFITSLDDLESKAQTPLDISIAKEHEKVFEKAINCLKEKEKQAFRLYFIEKMKMQDIGLKLNFTEGRISQIISINKPLVRKRMAQQLVYFYE